MNPLAGTLPRADDLTNIPRLITAYYEERPDPGSPAQRVSFGTSGHRGSALATGFNEWHVLAITQAICDFRREQNISGPLFFGIDTHPLSEPAAASALEVLAANGVEVMLALHDEYTPTPVISYAILTFNRGRSSGLADGILVTPSHNPPQDGGFKYNPTNGGPAGSGVTRWMGDRANHYLETQLAGVRRMPYTQALQAATTHRHDYVNSYVADLANVIDFDAIRGAGIHAGVDPLGGAGVHYWKVIADRYNIKLDVVSTTVDPTFRFMTLDWDGQIRMDPSSPFAMRSLIGLKDRYDVAFACDTDHDRHGIVTPSVGLLPANHYLSVSIDYLFSHRPNWNAGAAIGKTVVSSEMIDRVAGKVGRRVYEVPVGFKWFADGLMDGSLGFGGEESAGSSFLRRDGTVWTTDKDGIVPGLLSAEMTAVMQRDPGELYAQLAESFGAPLFERLDAPATPAQKKLLEKLSPQQVTSKALAGEPILKILTEAPGNGAAIGGVKVIAKSGWFAARPSGTENIYKIYAESFRDAEHLKLVQTEAQQIVNEALLATG